MERIQGLVQKRAVFVASCLVAGRDLFGHPNIHDLPCHNAS
ncbi:MAG: hypothetical protein ACK5UC_21990 [Planctomycetaceae bacterium]